MLTVKEEQLRLPAKGAPKPHTVYLTGLRMSRFEKQKPPLLVERRDQDFIEGLLDDLRDTARHDDLVAMAPKKPAGQPLIRLFPPVQRVFNMAVLEAFCDEPGQPRIDTAKIESSGMVLRRVKRVGTQTRYQAWIKGGSKVYGWEDVDEDADPSAERRRPKVSVGNPVLNALLPSNQLVKRAGAQAAALSDVTVKEQTMPLFVAPPDVCRSATKTLLFGLINITSEEQTEMVTPSAQYGATQAERADLAQHLATLLKQGAATSLPYAGETFGADEMRTALRLPEGNSQRDKYAKLDSTTFANVKGLLQQLRIEFDAFADTVEGKALVSELKKISVEYHAYPGGKLVKTFKTADQFLRDASETLLDAKTGKTFTMPHVWGAVSHSLAESILTKAIACLERQYKQLVPAVGRFESGAASKDSYVVRAFIRVKSARPGCPGTLIWSAYSPEFTIAPWFESSGMPPRVVELPDLFDGNVLKRMKPNVSFVVPPKLAALLKQDPKKLRDGEGKEGWDIMWICSFSIPIITLCAFIVLNIFLQLFALIFFWLPFLKICIPFPRKR